MRFILKLRVLIRNFVYADHHCVHGGFDDAERSSLCSGPCDREDYSLEPTEDYSLDDEVGRKFSQMTPIPVCFTSPGSLDSCLNVLITS